MGMSEKIPIITMSQFLRGQPVFVYAPQTNTYMAVAPSQYQWQMKVYRDPLLKK